MAADADPRNLQAKQALHALFASPEGRRSSSEAALSRTVVGAASSLQFSRGADLLAAGDAAGAIEPLQAAVKADPGFEPAWYNLGVAAWKLGRWEEARNAFSKASSLKRDRAESVFMLGAALVRLGRCPEAVKELERALAMKPDLRDARGFLAECYLKLGRAADAEEQLRRAKTGR
jgi:tetratricopeptide (TPR) repeat protein